jgi:DNA-binding beta-propeller fold protein YncE
VNEERLRRLLRDAELPDEAAARKRGWRVVRAAYEGRGAAAPRKRPRGRLALASAGAAAVILAIVLTPAGAKVADVFQNVTGIGNEKARPALSSLPAPGRLLVGSAEGPWVVRQDGSKRLLGAYRDATWSPRGLFVAATSSHELVAIDPKTGDVHWTIGGRNLRDAAWSPSGFRIAYQAAGALRLVTGAGNQDHMLAPRAADVAPAWRPLSHIGRLMVEKQVEPPEQLAFAEPSGRIRLLDTRSGDAIWATPPGPRPVALIWTPDGNRLLVVSPRSVRLFTASGALARTINLPVGTRARAAAIDPNGRALAVAVGQATAGRLPHSRVDLIPLGRSARPRVVVSDPGSFTGLAFSPDGRWLLVAWRDADQWLFVPLAGGKVRAVGHVSQQFAPGASGLEAFPRLDGWCCAG